MLSQRTKNQELAKVDFPVRLFINGPDGLVVFGSEYDRLPLPWGLDSEGPVLTYGPYLDAVAGFLCQDHGQPLRVALSRHLERPVSLQAIQSLEIISQKHGAFYHVAQARAKVSEKDYSFAVNSAIRPAQQTFLESEFALLRELHTRFPLGFLPRAYVLGTPPCAADGRAGPTLKSFIAEWFEGFHEFHLSRRAAENNIPSIRVWDDCPEETFLNAEETRCLYHEAAAILTAYLTPDSFSQIYPWHHAAGDFVLKRRKTGVKVRLITVRGYPTLVPLASDPLDRWIPLVHFFLNLSLRMRLDRLDGTGELVWASPDCLWGVVSGFLESWQQKAKGDRDLPAASAVLDVLRSFTPEEWLSLADLILADGLSEAEEAGFIQLRLEDHVTSLWRVIRDWPSLHAFDGWNHE
jgi:hypothetical protein